MLERFVPNAFSATRNPPSPCGSMAGHARRAALYARTIIAQDVTISATAIELDALHQ